MIEPYKALLPTSIKPYEALSDELFRTQETWLAFLGA